MFPTNEMLVMQAAAAEGGPTLDTALEVASLDSERLYQVEHHGHRVLWVPACADSLKNDYWCMHTWRGPATAGSI